MERKFRKTNFPISWLCGVCSGFGYYCGYLVWKIRICFVLLTLFTPWPIGLALVIVYLLLWIFLPEWDDNPDDFYEVTGD